MEFLLDFTVSGILSIEAESQDEAIDELISMTNQELLYHLTDKPYVTNIYEIDDIPFISRDCNCFPNSEEIHLDINELLETEHIPF